jgi:hypothetical protein
MRVFPIEKVNGSDQANYALFPPHNAVISNVFADHNMFIQDAGYFPVRMDSTVGTIIVQDNIRISIRCGISDPCDFRRSAPVRWEHNGFDTGAEIRYPAE